MGGVVVSIVGPTASGKTELAIEVANRLGTEIVNADARQVFKGMAIGTAQPTAEERAAAPHHFIDFLEPESLYSAGAFEADAVPVLTSLCMQKGAAVLAGGSGMYVEAALRGLDNLPADLAVRKVLNARLASGGLDPLLAELKQLDPAHAEKMDVNNPQRVVRALEVCLSTGAPFSSFHKDQDKERPWRVVSIGLRPDRALLRERIAERAERMMAQGWLDEVQALLPYRETNALNTVGYKELFQHLDGTMPLEDAMAQLTTKTRQFAKRQMTWFRKDPRTTWFDFDADTRTSTLEQAAAHAVAQATGSPLPPDTNLSS